MQDKTVIDPRTIEFVVVEPAETTEIATHMPLRAPVPATAYPLPSEIAVRSTLTALLGLPLHSFEILEQVGRFALVEYHPMGDDDPDIIVATGPGNRLFNKLMLRLQEARRDDLDWHAERWYQKVASIVETLGACLVEMEAQPDEARLVLTWAAAVRDFGLAI
ncbi:MAG: hypothetical protein M0R37_11845 [Bacteroidales bacterium]|jgi:hypothetical protein|nr:hypothetical protein [Bacteroidales bacterium]